MLRYILNSKRGKFTCPGCNKPKKLVRYEDTVTGEPLPTEYGRCDRQDSCGYCLTPYEKMATGRSYADDIREQEKLIDSRYNGKFGNHNPVVNRPLPKPVKSVANLTEKVYSLPGELVQRTQKRYETNSLIIYLNKLFDPADVRAAVERYHIGTAEDGKAVFWLLDEQKRARGGQVVLFDSNGHTVKKTRSDGELERSTRPVHWTLIKHLQRTNKPLPDWLTDYDKNAPKWPIPFGLHLLADESTDKPVCVVEAPKTAIVASLYFPQFIWMAVGALDYLTAERIKPIRGRKVILWPDLSKNGSAFEKWHKKGHEFGFLMSDFLEKNASEEERANGLDLCDFLERFNYKSFRQPSQTDVRKLPVKSWASNPALISLMDQLGLEVIEVRHLVDS